MKGILCAAVLLAACGGDDSEVTGDGNNNNGSADAPGGVGEPANLVGITLLHNQVRAAVDTTGISGGALPPMVWDATIAANAQAWAEMCIDTAAPAGLVDHSSQAYRSNVAGFAVVGENIFGSSNAATADQAVNSWASEKSGFTYPGNGCCGHYTQIVWRTSTHLGCANVLCNNLQYKGTIVCEYGPAGNDGNAPY